VNNLVSVATMVLLLGGLPSCKRPQPAPGDEGAAASAAPTVGSPTTKSASPAAAKVEPAKRPLAKVELLSNGAEPRKVLRLSLEKDQEQTVEVESRWQQLTVVRNGEIKAARLPPTTKLRWQTKVTDVSPGGDIGYTYQLATASEGALTSAADISRVSGTASVTPRAESRSDTLDATGSSEEQKVLMASAHELLKLSGFVFPEAPVGRGARWKVDTSWKEGAKDIVQSATYELKRIEGEQATLAASVTQNSTSAVANQEGTVNRQVTANIELDLHSVLPRQATVEIAAETATTFQGVAIQGNSTIVLTIGQVSN